jgi:hypothetical protein
MSTPFDRPAIYYYQMLREKQCIPANKILRPQPILINGVNPVDILEAKSFRRQIVELAWNEIMDSNRNVPHLYYTWYLKSLQACS